MILQIILMDINVHEEILICPAIKDLLVNHYLVLMVFLLYFYLKLDFDLLNFLFTNRFHLDFIFNFRLLFLLIAIIINYCKLILKL